MLSGLELKREENCWGDHVIIILCGLDISEDLE